MSVKKDESSKCEHKEQGKILQSVRNSLCFCAQTHLMCDKKKLDSAAADLTAIAAQKSVITHAKKSIATYRLREGQAIGTKVTLRGKRMYDFLDKLITVALPRVKDFRGLSKSKFDGRGNYAFGIKEHLIFPEISVDKIDAIRGMDIVIATTAKTDDEARALLTKIGLPLVLK